VPLAIARRIFSIPTLPVAACLLATGDSLESVTGTSDARPMSQSEFVVGSMPIALLDFHRGRDGSRTVDWIPVRLLRVLRFSRFGLSSAIRQSTLLSALPILHHLALLLFYPP
jgi:hypothetical protein